MQTHPEYVTWQGRRVGEEEKSQQDGVAKKGKGKERRDDKDVQRRSSGKGEGVDSWVRKKT